jgi:hypothetical protein
MLVENVPFETDVPPDDPGRLYVGLIYRGIIAHAHLVVDQFTGYPFLLHLRGRRGEVDLVDPLCDFSTVVVPTDRFEVRERVEGQNRFRARLVSDDKDLWSADGDAKSTFLQFLRNSTARRGSADGS